MLELDRTMATLLSAQPDLPVRSPARGELRLILETALDAVVVMNSEGIVVAWNDRAAGTFGWTQDEAVGRKMADLIIPERYREAHKRGLRRYLESGRGKILGRRIEVSGLRKNGEEFPAELSISPIRDGENILFVGCVRDISDRNALSLARTELARVMQMSAMGEMAASVAHEISQPLAAIVASGNAGLRWLASPSLDLDKARAALKRIIDDSHHASEVIAGIRSMFRKNGHANTPQDVNEIIRDALPLVGREVKNQRISVQTELSDALPRVVANQVQLRQVIVNLIMNAVDAMSAVVNRERILLIKTQAGQSNYLRIAVEDCGMGVDPKNIDRIFDAFFTTKSHGMGMGLSICRSIVESHGGRLSVSHREPHGSIFEVLLPAGAADPK
jgi:PAS domain S-box-containing protein